MLYQLMASSEPLRVFISYARIDGVALAQRLQSDLTKEGVDAWLDTQRIGAGAVWSGKVEREIDTRAVTVAVLTQGSYKSAVCRGEQIRALRKGKRLIPVLGSLGADVPVYIEAVHYRDFTNDAHYTVRLGELLADIRGDTTATLPGNYRQTRVTYITTPPQVPNYLERREDLQALRDAVFAEDHRQPIALTALAGMGGIGKTVLAKALTEDEVVQRAFPDGIVWITASKERKRDFIEEMREVGKALGDDLSRYDNALACENQYRTTIANKAALIVVDDVWSKADIERLLAESPRSRFLFTTRDASIGRFVSAREHRADLLDVVQSRQLLAAWADIELDGLPTQADQVIGECGRLPLALSVVGAMLRGADEEFWTDTLDLLRRADLSEIQRQLPPGQESFFKAVEVSFRSFEPEMQERYKALAVLLEDMAAPLPILETLWNVNRAEARRLSRQLVDRSLAQRDADGDGIQLHDLQLDYIRAQSPDRDALDLIHGAVRLSSYVIRTDPSQFASQMVGRLLLYRETPAIARFTERVAEGAHVPWLLSLHPSLDSPGGPLLRTLSGHAHFVMAVTVTPDGERAVSGSCDNTLKVWDLRSGRELRTLCGHTNAVEAVEVTPDGQRAVSASEDQTLKVWDLSNGRELCTLSGHTHYVNAVAVTPDGRRAVSASNDGTLRVWDLSSGRELRALSGHTRRVTSLALTPDGLRAVSASSDYTLKVWDLSSGRELCTLSGHASGVTAVAVTPNGQRAVSASNDYTLKVWDLSSGRELRTLSGHTDAVTAVVTPDGQRAVSASEDQTLKVWDLSSGRELCTLSGHASGITAVAVTPDGQRAISASLDRTLRVWDLSCSGRKLRSFSGHTRRVKAVAVTPDGQRAVSASEDHTLEVWDLRSGRQLCTLTGHRRDVDAVAVTPDGQGVVSASFDQTLKVWDLVSGRELRTLSGHTNAVKAVELTPDGQRAVSASGYTLKVWDLSSGHGLRTLSGHASYVNAVALTPDGLRAVSASSDQTLKVWDLSSGRELCTLSGHADLVSEVAVTPDGERVVSGSFDQTLKVWDLNSGRELCTLSGHSHSVTAMALIPDGLRAVSASMDKTLKVWDLSSGRELCTLSGHTRCVNAVAVTPDGQGAVSASEDQTLKVWELETGACLATFTCDSVAVCCAYSDALNLIIAGDAGGHLHFLRLVEPKPKL
jgi:WD40 repeat protein